MRLLGGFGALAAAAGAGAWLFACGGGSANLGANSPGNGPDIRSTAIEHEPCDEKGKVVAIDVNGDGKPDIRRVFDGNREVCRISDLNHDGKPDLYQYFDQGGALRRREYDLDDNGVMNMVETLKGGRVVARQIDTMNQGKLDTWDTFDPNTGKLVKRERDSTSDGRIDQWWTFDGDKITIAMDKNGDGKPDPETTVTLGADGKAIAPPKPNANGEVSDGGTQQVLPPTPPPSSDLTPTSATDGGVPSLDPDGGAKVKRGGAKR